MPRHCTQLPCLWSTWLLSTVHQLGAAACILASLTLFLMMLCTLTLNAYVPLQCTTFQFSKASSQLSFVAKVRHSPWLIAVLWTLVTFYMASWLSHRLLARRDWNLDTRLFLPHGNYCTTYLSWTSALPNGRTSHGTWSTPRVCQCSVSTFLGLAQDLLKSVWPEQLGSNSIACVLALGVLVCLEYGLISSAKCKCGTSEQTTDHII